LFQRTAGFKLQKKLIVLKLLVDTLLLIFLLIFQVINKLLLLFKKVSSFCFIVPKDGWLQKIINYFTKKQLNFLRQRNISQPAAIG
jgi:hypothetical protein